MDSLGWVYFKQGRYPEAVRELERAIALVPDDPVILEHLGDAYQKVRAYGKALQAYSKAEEKAPAEDLEKLAEKIKRLDEMK